MQQLITGKNIKTHSVKTRINIKLDKKQMRHTQSLQPIRQLQSVKGKNNECYYGESNRKLNEYRSDKSLTRRYQFDTEQAKINSGNKIRTILKVKPKQISIKLTDVIKSPRFFDNIQSRHQSKSVCHSSEKKQDNSKFKNLKVQVTNFNQGQQESTQQVQNHAINILLNKHLSQETKTQNQNQETLIVSEIKADFNDSNQFKKTQKRLIKLQNLVSSTGKEKKPHQLANVFLNILQKQFKRTKSDQIPLKQKKQEPSQNCIQGNGYDQQPQIQKSLPISRKISSVTGKEIRNRQQNVQTQPLQQQTTTTPRMLIKNLTKQTFSVKQTNQKASTQRQKAKTSNYEQCQFMKFPKRKMNFKQNFNPKKLDFRKISQIQEANRNAPLFQQTPRFNSQKNNLLQQIQSRPRINKSFIDPFEDISSVQGEVSRPNLIENSQDSAFDLQNLLNFSQKENASK